MWVELPSSLSPTQTLLGARTDKVALSEKKRVLVGPLRCAQCSQRLVVGELEPGGLPPQIMGAIDGSKSGLPYKD